MEKRRAPPREGCAPRAEEIFFYLREANFPSSPFASIAPGIRVPSVKKIVGVPVTLSFRPSSNILSFGVVQDSRATGAAFPLSIHSSHALSRSAEHHIFFDLTDESSARMLYINV